MSEFPIIAKKRSYHLIPDAGRNSCRLLSLRPRPENLRYRSLFDHWRLAIDDLKIQLAKEGRADEDVKILKDLVKNAIFGTGTAEEAVEPPAESVESFSAYFREFAERKGNGRTKAIYLATLSRMLAFDPNLEKLAFEDVTVRWLTDFDNFLAKTSPSQNARNIHFRNIRTVINAAVDDELTTYYPFRRFKIRPTPTRKRSLSLEGIQKVFNATRAGRMGIEISRFLQADIYACRDKRHRSMRSYRGFRRTR